MRKCSVCGTKLDVLARADRLTCSTRCRVAAHRARALPESMTTGRRWVRAAGKRPITVEGRAASTTDPSTWSTYRECRRSKAGSGLGIMLGSGLGCYDLDHVTDEEAREFAAQVPERVVFAERSMSGEGVHLFVEAGEGPGSVRLVGGVSVEFYSRARFIRVTGQRFAL